MPAVAVAILTEDSPHLSVLQGRVESTAMAHTVFSHAGFPTGPTDPILRQIQDLHAEIVLVDVDSRQADRASAAIELLRSTTHDVAVFALGEMHEPLVIVAAMRAGASEFLERNGSTTALIEAFTRFSAQKHKRRNVAGRARVFSFLNAKAGSGAITLAVNTAITLQRQHGNTVLVDCATLGHTALHLNVRPQFGLLDAVQNLHRLDASLLESLMTPCADGLHLLAGPQIPGQFQPTPAELARLFDLLVTYYRYVVVDCSSRLDAISRIVSDLSNRVLLVAQADVVALWSANRIQAFLTDGASSDKVQLLVNRYKKIPGFTDEDAQKATNCKVFWKVPNQYQAIAPAIDRGQPFAIQEHLEVSRSLRMLADALVAAEGGVRDGSGGSDSGREKAGRRVLKPLRANE